MDLQSYLQRIGYGGPTKPDLDVLRAVHRHHACAIAYENLDVILERPVDQDPARIFDKIVDQGRGGWCYEMNGLLGWALGELGFHVTRVCGGVMRARFGDDAFGNHLVLRVALDDATWIADVGLGDGMLEPLPLRAGVHEQFGRRFRLEALGDGEWRFHNRSDGMPPDFDFVDDHHTEARLETRCDELQTDPDSMFRQNLICQRMSEGGGSALLGRVLRNFDPTVPRRLIGSEAELIDVLESVFGLQVPPLGDLWQRVSARHAELFGDTPVEEISFGPPPAAAP
ncbi:MAG: arylamine N-acetyltransferase [Pseudomonadales bacterium]